MPNTNTTATDTASLLALRAQARRMADNAAAISVRLAAFELAQTLTAMLQGNVAQLNAESRLIPGKRERAALYQRAGEHGQ